MEKTKVFCDGKEYDMGFAHASYPRFRPAMIFENLIAYFLGYLSGTEVWLGESWTIVTNGDLTISRLNELPEVVQRQSKHTLWLCNIECASDQIVEAYVLDNGSFVVVAQPGAIVGVPAGVWEFSFSQTVRETTVCRIL